VYSPCEKSQILDAELQEQKKRLLELCMGAKRKVLPDALDLVDLDFAVFGGLSWKSEFCRTGSHAAHAARFKDFLRLCKSTCKRLKIRFRYVHFCFRDEPSPADEWHVHFLIAANGTEAVSHEVLSAELQATWTKRFNFGIAKIEVFDPHRKVEGLSYVLGVSRGNDGQEIQNPPVFSQALWNLMVKKKLHH